MNNSFIGNIYKQNCGDSLLVIEKSYKKGKDYLYRCQFQKYPCEVLAFKYNILKGQVYNSEIENQIFIGKEFPQKCGDSLFVLEKSNKKTKKGETLYKCIFKNFYNEIYSQKYLIIKGNVINSLVPNIFKQGYVGIGKYNSKNYKNIFSCWYSILSRCYNLKDKKYSIYGAKGIEICNKWKCFQNFAKWYEENSKWNIFGYKLELDKDILFNIYHSEYKFYSPETCLLIPAALNGFIAGDCLECGVQIYKKDNKIINYYSKFCSKSLGIYSTFEEAKEIYANAKYKQWIKEIDKFDLPSNLKEILLKYNFSWNEK